MCSMLQYGVLGGNDYDECYYYNNCFYENSPVDVAYCNLEYVNPDKKDFNLDPYSSRSSSPTKCRQPLDDQVPDQSDEDDSTEEVFELELDWTPVGKESVPSPVEPRKDSYIAVKQPVIVKKEASKKDVESCQCLYCSGRPNYEAGDSRGVKRSPGASPPSKKVLLVGSPSKTPKALLGAVVASRSPIATLLRCDTDVYEYTSEAYHWKRSMETRSWVGCEMALAIQPVLTAEMRQTLLMWMISVNHYYNFSLETWCLTVSLLDRFLAIQPLNSDCLQLAGLTAFFIAAKCEEVEPPQISELICLCASSYDRTQFQLMEMAMLNRLKFEILSPTTAFFLHHQVELERLTDTWPYELSVLMVERVLCDAWLSNFTPSVVSSCIFNVIADNWHPDIYHEDIIADEDFLEHIYSLVRCAMMLI